MFDADLDGVGRFCLYPRSCKQLPACPRGSEIEACSESQRATHVRSVESTREKDVSGSHREGRQVHRIFIKGKAHEGLKEKDAAIAAYKAAATLTHARAWDPAGRWFWSPAEAATERLEELR